MQKLILKLLLLSILFIVFDNIIGIAMSRRIVNNLHDKRLYNIITTDKKYSIYVLGSSRAARNVNCSEIEKITGLSAYNIGYPGTNIEFHADILYSIIKSGKTPKYILLLVDSTYELIDNTSLSYNYDVLYPLQHYGSVRELLDKRGAYNIFTKNITTFKMRHCINIIIHKDLTDSLNKINNDGSMPLNFRSKNYNTMVYGNNTSYSTATESPILLSSFKRFIELCNYNKIKLIIIFPPNYNMASHKFIERIKYLAANKALLADFSMQISDKRLFYDNSHLNENGSLILSREIGLYIRKLQQ